MPIRPTPAQRAALEQALVDHHTLPTKAENLKAHGPLFVDTGDLLELDRPDWQVIFGAPGSGKTHHLRVFQQRANTSPQHSRVLAIYLSMHDAVHLPRHGAKVDDVQKATAYFHLFMEQLGDELSATARQLRRGRAFLERLQRGDRQRLITRVDAKVRQILDLVERGQPLGAFIEEAWSQEDFREDADGSSGELTARGGVSMRGPSAQATVSAKRRRSRQSTSSERSSRKGPLVPRHAKARKVLVELTEILELERLVILIDNWSDLDPSGRTAVQPAFAELLRRTLHGEPTITVKIATNPYQTRFGNRASDTELPGLVIGDHIEEAFNLSHALLGEAEEPDFYATLLFKRLLLRSEGRLDSFIDARGARPAPEFIWSLFRTDPAFAEAIRAAEGNPRRFITIVRTLARQSKWTVDEGWTVADVRQVLKRMSATPRVILPNDFRGSRYQPWAEQLLIDCIQPVVIATKSPEVLLPHDKMAHDTIATAVDELLDRELLLPYDGTLPPQVTRRYAAYRVSYGVQLDWARPIRASRARSARRLAETSDVSRFVVDCESLSEAAKPG